MCCKTFSGSLQSKTWSNLMSLEQLLRVTLPDEEDRWEILRHVIESASDLDPQDPRNAVGNFKKNHTVIQ